MRALLRRVRGRQQGGGAFRTVLEEGKQLLGGGNGEWEAFPAEG